MSFEIKTKHQTEFSLTTTYMANLPDGAMKTVGGLINFATLLPLGNTLWLTLTLGAAVDSDGFLDLYLTFKSEALGIWIDNIDPTTAGTDYATYRNAIKRHKVMTIDANINNDVLRFPVFPRDAIEVIPKSCGLMVDNNSGDAFAASTHTGSSAPSIGQGVTI